MSPQRSTSQSRVRCNEPDRGWLGLDDWTYDDFFDRPRAGSAGFSFDAVVNEVDEAVASRTLDTHRFFDLAAASADALLLWVSQELVMTNAFSQLVLLAASRV